MHRSSGTPAVAFGVTLLALLATGCPSAPDAPPAAPPPPAIKPCGKETVRLAEGYDAAGRECIWQAYKVRQPAEFTTTRFTIEGDPITYRVEVTPHGVIVDIDSKDRFGHKGLFHHACRNFERIVQDGNPDRFGFALSACTGGGAERLAVP